MFTPNSNGHLRQDERVGEPKGQSVDAEVVSLNEVDLPPFIARSVRTQPPEIDPVWKNWAENSRLVPLPGEPVIRGTAVVLKSVQPTQDDVARLAALDLGREFTSIAAFKAEIRRSVEQWKHQGVLIREQPTFPQEQVRELRQQLRLPSEQ